MGIISKTDHDIEKLLVTFNMVTGRDWQVHLDK